MIIYGIKFLGKIIYVGQTIRTLKQRISSYRNSAKNSNCNLYMINHLRVYGIDNHEFFIIDDNISSREELDKKEIQFIKTYNTLYPNGLNLTEGGGSPVFSDETKRKMSNSRKGKTPWNKGTKGQMPPVWSKGLKLPSPSEETRKKMSDSSRGEKNHFFGKTHTKESLEKLCRALKGRGVWNKIKNRIIKLDKYENIIKVYDNKKAAGEDGFEINSLNRAIKTGITYRGFYFKVEQ